MTKKRKQLFFLVLLSIFTIFIAYKVYLNNLTPPVAIDHLPTNKALFVLNNEKIIIKFDRNLNPTQKRHLQLITLPTHEFTANWPDDRTIEYSPNNPLTTNENYKLSLLFNKSSILEFSFKTNTYTKNDLIKQKDRQIEDDLYFANTRNKFYKENPWKINLPLKEEGFTITYNEPTEKFRIIITKTTQTTTLDNYQTLAKKRLLEIGVPQEIIDFVIVDLSKTNN